VARQRQRVRALKTAEVPLVPRIHGSNTRRLACSGCRRLALLLHAGRAAAGAVSSRPALAAAVLLPRAAAL
jgi:hypothetical protein